MKLFDRFRKPEWTHKDPAIRLRAVQSSQDPALIGLLPELVQTDPDAAVRSAALRRIDDPVLLERRLRGELDPSVAAAARKRLIDVLCSASISEESASAALLQSHDAELLTRVAEDSPFASLRKLALERCERPALLVQRCIHDPDPALRLWLLDRIDTVEALQKIVEGSRKRDKRVTRAAKEKLDALQLASGDAQALSRHVMTLCDALAKLARELPDDRDQQLAALRDEWLGLHDRVDVDLQRRANGGLAMAEAALSAARGEPVPRPASEMVDQQAAELEVTSPLAEAPIAPQEEPALAALLAALPSSDAEDFDERVAAIRDEAKQHPPGDNVRIRAQQAELRSALDALIRQRTATATAAQNEQLVKQLQTLEASLQDGSIAAAREARDAMGRRVPRELQQRLATADEALAKLERWQRWSGSKVRSRLCDEAEALYGSGVHPDALANKVKELKAEWAKLDEIDGDAAPGAEHGITRRFNALCHRALAPARPYFEKRRALRGERSEQIAVLIGESASLPAELNDLLALRKRVRDALPALDEAAPEKRGQHGRQLRERIAEIDAALKIQRESAELAKRSLITRLRRELGTADGPTGVDLAKRAQADWKRLPRSERKVDDALWAELRELIDPLFTQQREVEVAEQTRSKEADAAAQAILSDLDALAAADPERLLHASAHLDALQTRWREVSAAMEPPTAKSDHAKPDRSARGGRDQAPRGQSRDASGPRVRRDGDTRPRSRTLNPLEARFEAASAAVLNAQQEALRERERQHLTMMFEAGNLLDKLQASPDRSNAESIDQQLQRLTLPPDARDALNQRRDRILSASSDTASADAYAERLAVRAELDAGIDSPATAVNVRRDEQMQRLAAKMSGQHVVEPRAAIRSNLIELQSLHNLSPTVRHALQERMVAAYTAAAARS